MKNFTNFAIYVYNYIMKNVMKRSLIVVMILVCATFVNPCYGQERRSVVEGDPLVVDTMSYCVGAAFAATLRSGDSKIFDFNVSELNKGIKEGLNDAEHPQFAECYNLLDTFFSKTIVERKNEFDKSHAENSLSRFEPFRDDEERNHISYNYGIFMGVNMKKMLDNDCDTIHAYWLCKAFEDTYYYAPMFSQKEMLEYLKGYLAKASVAEVKINQ